jgi:predicted GNAT family acetyltransferase
MQWRYATDEDVKLLAELNRQLIVDEGHHNPMGMPALEQRMRAWLASEYRAVLFHQGDDVVAYALYRIDEWERIHIRQFFVVDVARRQGIGREALRLFRSNIVPRGKQMIVEVLTRNTAARAFYEACGFLEYAVSLLSDGEGSAS